MYVFLLNFTLVSIWKNKIIGCVFYCCFNDIHTKVVHNCQSHPIISNYPKMKKKTLFTSVEIHIFETFMGNLVHIECNTVAVNSWHHFAQINSWLADNRRFPLDNLDNFISVQWFTHTHIAITVNCTIHFYVCVGIMCVLKFISTFAINQLKLNNKLYM